MKKLLFLTLCFFSSIVAADQPDLWPRLATKKETSFIKENAGPYYVICTKNLPKKTVFLLKDKVINGREDFVNKFIVNKKGELYPHGVDNILDTIPFVANTYLKGEPHELTLTSEDGSFRFQKRIVPIPYETVLPNKKTLSITLEHPLGEKYSYTLSNFIPGEKVVVSLKNQSFTETYTIDENGTLSGLIDNTVSSETNTITVKTESGENLSKDLYQFNEFDKLAASSSYGAIIKKMLSSDNIEEKTYNLEFDSYENPFIPTFKSNDLPRNKKYVCRIKKLSGTEIQGGIYLFNDKGILTPEYCPNFSLSEIEPFIKGEEVIYLLENSEQTIKAQTHGVPFPLKHKLENGKEINIRTISPKMTSFIVRLSGFQPHEKICFFSHSGDEEMAGPIKVSKDGSTLQMICPEVLGKTGGEGKVQVLTEDGEKLEVKFYWGDQIHKQYYVPKKDEKFKSLL